MDSLIDIIASRFIARHDVYSVQRSDGSYNPVNSPITRSVISDHLKGNATYGHYLLGGDNLDTAKFFCFDIDLATTGQFYIEPDLSIVPIDQEITVEWIEANRLGPFAIDPRAAWKSRDPQSRPYFKERMRTTGEILTGAIHSLGIDTCMTYSGHKGIHVYGFTGPMRAVEVRAIAKQILTDTGIFEPSKGDNFYENFTGLIPGMSLELFPKQDKVEPGHYGNLMRMEFGVNLKSPDDPCFIVDQRLAHVKLEPHVDPVSVLLSGNPWKG